MKKLYDEPIVELVRFNIISDVLYTSTSVPEETVVTIPVPTADPGITEPELPRN